MHLNAEERSTIRKFLAEAEAAFDLSHGDPAVHGLMMREDSPAGASHMMKLHLEELLLLLMREHTTPLLKKPRLRLYETYNDEFVNEMVKYMCEHLDTDLTIADLCRKFSYGKTYLCTRFLSVTGKSINRYFVELKVNAAKQIIREESRSHELFPRISDALGFSSPSYFYATFKRVTGMTPTEYSRSVHQYDR